MNFFGLEAARNLPEHPVWFLPIPYEATVTFGRGTSFGPQAIIEASVSIEEYDAEAGLDATEQPGICTAPALHPDMSGPREALVAIEAAVQPLHAPGRLLIALGGEHSITVPLVRAAATHATEPPLVLYFDAHADLRAEYSGTPYSHAATARRLLEAGCGIVMLGIRSMSRDDVQALGAGGVHLVLGRQLATGGLSEAAELVRELAAGRLLYVSLDMDFFDPSLVPAVGTPEPGGAGWWEFVALLDAALAACKRLAGADVVELTGPLCDWRLGSAVTAAKAAYRVAAQAVARGAIAAGPPHGRGKRGRKREEG